MHLSAAEFVGYGKCSAVALGRLGGVHDVDVPLQGFSDVRSFTTLEAADPQRDRWPTRVCNASKHMAKFSLSDGVTTGKKHPHPMHPAVQLKVTPLLSGGRSPPQSAGRRQSDLSGDEGPER